MKYIISLISVLALTWIISCSGKPGRSQEAEGPAITVGKESLANLITMNLPAENTRFKLGDMVKVVMAQDSKGEPPDSIVIWFDGKAVTTLGPGLWEYSIPSSFTATTGRKPLKVTAWKKGKARTTITRFMIVLSDKIPVRNKFRVINTFPHDRDAFTQGLFYDSGVLYEGTGQETGSSLREVELTTGKVLRQLNLEPPLFGEGITLFGDRIYQVTWRSKVGFVYDKATFSLINRIYYQSEGWGLTTLNDRIVMSDGTNVLWFMDPEMFTVVSRLEVYDNEKKADQLNELEYINGEIWANMWMTDLIARIDPVSGKVLGYLDLKGILKDSETDTSADVLNGIAYDREGNRIFVTGKNWPELFEIKITE
ncbi:MAG: glutaminyl-peptide cyclotransferase [Bacteroidota bacterium]